MGSNIQIKDNVVISVIIADDHMLFKAAVKTVLSSKKNIKIIAEAENGSELLNLLKTTQPNVILLDIQMPVMDGVAILPEIKKLYPDIRVIMLSTLDDQRMVTKLLELGANAYLIKTCAFQKNIFSPFRNTRTDSPKNTRDTHAFPRIADHQIIGI